MIIKMNSILRSKRGIIENRLDTDQPSYLSDWESKLARDDFMFQESVWWSKKENTIFLGPTAIVKHVGDN